MKPKTTRPPGRADAGGGGSVRDRLHRHHNLKDHRSAMLSARAAFAVLADRHGGAGAAGAALLLAMDQALDLLSSGRTEAGARRLAIVLRKAAGPPTTVSPRADQRQQVLL